MNIGIDLDGVVFDTETYFRAYADLYDLVSKNKVISKVICNDSFGETNDVKDLEAFNETKIKSSFFISSVYRYSGGCICQIVNCSYCTNNRCVGCSWITVFAF